MEKLNEKQIEFLNKYTIGTWKLNPITGLVDVEGSFNCCNEGLKDFCDIEFGIVSGYFDCSFNEISSLKGLPKEVGGDFDCQCNQFEVYDFFTKVKGKFFY